MINFQVTFQADEPLYGEYKKIGLISVIMLRDFYDNWNTFSRTNFNHLLLPRKRIHYYALFLWKCLFLCQQHFI